MWVFLSDAFLSIVAHRTKPNVLLVRGRIAGDIERAFEGYKFTVKQTAAADYAFRAEISHMDVREVLANYVNTIAYDNFKSSVRDPGRHAAYMRCWAVMEAYQRAQARPMVPRLAQKSPGRRGKRKGAAATRH